MSARGLGWEGKYYETIEMMLLQGGGVAFLIGFFGFLPFYFMDVYEIHNLNFCCQRISFNIKCFEHLFVHPPSKALEIYNTCKEGSPKYDTSLVDIYCLVQFMFPRLHKSEFFSNTGLWHFVVEQFTTCKFYRSSPKPARNFFGRQLCYPEIYL